MNLLLEDLVGKTKSVIRFTFINYVNDTFFFRYPIYTNWNTSLNMINWSAVETLVLEMSRFRAINRDIGNQSDMMIKQILLPLRKGIMLDPRETRQDDGWRMVRFIYLCTVIGLKQQRV